MADFIEPSVLRCCFLAPYVPLRARSKCKRVCHVIPLRPCPGLALGYDIFQDCDELEGGAGKDKYVEDGVHVAVLLAKAVEDGAHGVGKASCQNPVEAVNGDGLYGGLDGNDYAPADSDVACHGDNGELLKVDGCKHSGEDGKSPHYSKDGPAPAGRDLS